MKNLIGIYSPYPQSGKSTVSDILWEIAGYEKLPFATHLKEICFYFLQITGVPDAEAQRLIYEDKEEQLPNFPAGVTARYMMQHLGTNFARDAIDPTIWVRAWANTLCNLPKSIPNIVVEDVRFVNEVDAIRVLGGVLWKVERPKPSRGFFLDFLDKAMSFLKKGHHSEGNLENVSFDAIIVNDGSLEDLKQKVIDALGSIEVGQYGN